MSDSDYDLAINDHYTTLETKQTEIEDDVILKQKEANKNDRKGKYELDESHKLGYIAYYIGIVYYILFIICFGLFIYNKEYLKIVNCILYLFLLFLPYLLYSYIVPILVTIVDFIGTKIIPKNVYYDL